MMNWTNCPIIVIVLFVKLVFGIQSSCQWKGQFTTNDYNCRLVCVGGSDLRHSIESQWSEHPECHADGLYLEFKRLSASFSKRILPANWFEANVKIQHVVCDMTSFDAIEVNAFDAEAFKSIKSLSLVGLQLRKLGTGAFNGLESLEKLNINQAIISESKTGMLDALNQTLKEFTIERSDEFMKERITRLQIESYTGSEQLTVEYIRMRYYIYEIASDALVGLTNIKYLDFSHCDIAIVHRGAFEPISSSLKVLRIENNPLVSLAPGLFDPIPLGYDTYIFLGNGEPLRGMNCKCEGIPSNFVLTTCYTDFCSKIILTKRESTTSLLNSTTSTIEMTTPTPPSANAETSTTTESDRFTLSSECEADNVTINMKASSQSMNLTSDHNGDIIVLSIDGTIAENSSLIWFATNDQGKRFTGSLNMNCLSRNYAPRVDVKNLKNNSDYIICVMNGSDAMVSSLNCISYTNSKLSEQRPTDISELRNDNVLRNTIVMTLVFSCGILFGVMFVVVQRSRLAKVQKYNSI